MDQKYQRVFDYTKTLLKNKGEGITPDTLLFKERLLDSMNILDLIGFLEKQMGRRLRDEEIIMGNFQSIRKIADTFNVS